MWKTKKSHNVSETGFVSVLRWMGQDKPEDGDRSSLRNVVGFFVFHIQHDG
jgi:hypothetical protein